MVSLTFDTGFGAVLAFGAGFTFTESTLDEPSHSISNTSGFESSASECRAVCFSLDFAADQNFSADPAFGPGFVATKSSSDESDSISDSSGSESSGSKSLREDH